MARFELTDNHRIEPDQPAEEAVRAVFMVLLADLRKNVAGTIEGEDPEYLHDLRVATRRTRSLLTQLKKVMSPEEARYFAAEFKWLGQLTGTCRDLDVWILERNDQRASQSAADAALLDPLDERIADRRSLAHTTVIEGLRSHRFAGLLENWEAFLQTPTTAAKPPSHARRKIKEVAARRISRAYQRVARRGRDLNTDSPASMIHRLRIDAKKLRYLLECFRFLFPTGVFESSIGELKMLQDALGGFNDTVMQLRYLAKFRAELEDGVGADAMRAIEHLAVDLTDRQQTYRSDLLVNLADFTIEATQREFNAFFRSQT